MTPAVDPLSAAAGRTLSVYAEETFVSQTELARRTAISQSQISKIFRGERHLTVTQLADLSRALGLDPVAVLATAQDSLRK